MKVIIDIIPKVLAEAETNKDCGLCKQCIFYNLADCAKLEGQLDCVAYEDGTIFVINPNSATEIAPE